MRTLLWFTVGFVSSITAAAYGIGKFGFLVPAVVICFLICATALAALRTGKGKIAIAVFTGCALGAAWFLLYSNQVLGPISEPDQSQQYFSVTISDYSRETELGSAAEGILVIDGREYPVGLYLKESMNLRPGDTVSAVFRSKLTFPEDGTTGYYPGKGVFMMLYQTGEVFVSSPEEVPARFFPAVLRKNIKDTLARFFTGETGAFVKALILGDTRDFSYGLDTAFRISGIRHIVAVSGLHISILYSVIGLLMFRQRHMTALLGIPVLVLFAAVAGFTPSVTRACIMVCLMLLARVFNREYDAPTALAFSVLVMTVVNPWVITSASLQMSVGCVAGILMFNGSISGWLEKHIPAGKGITAKLRKAFCSSVSVSLSAMTLVTPLSAFYFGTVSLMSVVTNVLVLWAVNLVFNGLVALVCISWAVPSIAALLAGLLEYPVLLILQIAKTVSSLPLAAVYTESPYIICWLIFVYLLLGVFLFQKEKQPGILLCCSVAGLCMALLAGWVEPMLDDTRITMLDVGQGQSILLQTEGRSYLLDCGGEDEQKTADLITETLLSQGISRLDGVILTHFDQDHSGALDYLLQRMEVEMLFLPDMASSVFFENPHGQTYFIREDVELMFDHGKMTLYAPEYQGDENENSLCVLFETEKCAILITGDRSAVGERMLMRHVSLPDVDILVAGHHGAADSTSQELLSAVTPELVLISVGEDNRYGHPAPQLLARLEQSGCQIARTDINGTIIIRR